MENLLIAVQITVTLLDIEDEDAPATATADHKVQMVVPGELAHDGQEAAVGLVGKTIRQSVQEVIEVAADDSIPACKALPLAA